MDGDAKVAGGALGAKEAGIADTGGVPMWAEVPMWQVSTNGAPNRRSPTKELESEYRKSGIRRPINQRVVVAQPA